MREFARNFLDPNFVHRIRVTVNQGDGERFDPLIDELLNRDAGGVLIERNEHVARN